MAIDPALIISPSPLETGLWTWLQSAYIVAVLLYTIFIIPKHVAPLVCLARKGHLSKLVVKTPAFDVYSNTSGYRIGTFSRWLVRLFLLLTGTLPMLFTFVVVPILFFLALCATQVSPQYHGIFSLSQPSSFLPLFFLDRSRVFSISDTQNASSRAAAELARNAIIASAVETGEDPFSSNFKIVVNLYAISWLMSAGLISWGIHLSQVVVAKWGFYSELSVARRWTTSQSLGLVGRQHCPVYTPFSKAVIVAIVLALISCALYFTVDLVDDPLYYYASHTVTYLMVLALTFTVFASFSSVFEFREQMAIACNNMFSQRQSRHQHQDQNCSYQSSLEHAGVSNDYDIEENILELRNEPFPSSSPYAVTLATTLNMFSRNTYMDEFQKKMYRGFMTLDPGFLHHCYIQHHTCEPSSVAGVANSHNSDSHCQRYIGLRQYLVGWFITLVKSSTICKILFKARHQKFVTKEESALQRQQHQLHQRQQFFQQQQQSQSGVWVDEEWLSETVKTLYNHNSSKTTTICCSKKETDYQKPGALKLFPFGIFTYFTKSISALFSSSYSCSYNTSSSTFTTTTNTKTNEGYQETKPPNPISQNKHTVSDVAACGEPWRRTDCHYLSSMLLVAFKDDVDRACNTAASSLGPNEVGLGGSAELAQAVEHSILKVVNFDKVLYEEHEN